MSSTIEQTYYSDGQQLLVKDEETNLVETFLFVGYPDKGRTKEVDEFMRYYTDKLIKEYRIQVSLIPHERTDHHRGEMSTMSEGVYV